MSFVKIYGVPLSMEATEITEVRIEAPAKINLYLDILKRRSDGYHEVEMIMQTVSLFDVVTIRKTDDCDISLTCTCKIADRPQNNTAYIAAEKFFAHTKIENPGVNISVKKKIPQGAGLAGGSADASAILVGLDRLFSTGLPKNELAKIGEQIGADVPFCIFGGTMLATGTGTTLMPLFAIPKCWIIIVKPSFSVSTKGAYEASDRCVSMPRFQTASRLISAIKAEDLHGIAKNLYNRFECVLNLGEVAEIKEMLNKNGALNSCMTGTGSAVYGIFDDEEKAQICKKVLSAAYDQVFLVTPVN